MTIKDLARETGYSVGTISRVLNNHPSVSEKARREITEAIARSGFERNENAKNLKQQKNEGVLVLVKGRKNELFAAIIERLQQFFDRTSYTMMLDYFDEQEDEARRAVAVLGGRVRTVASYELGGLTRRVVIIDKLRPTPAAYPRRFAKIKQKPL